MEDCCKDAILHYKTLSGDTKLKDIRAPVCPDGVLTEPDECTRGELAGAVCSLLMNDLWLARPSRPDVQRCI